MRPTSGGTRHRPGAFKVSNKGHKSGRHKSNRGLKRMAGGGRVSKATASVPAAKVAAAAISAKTARLRRLSKSEQRNRLKMIRQAQLAKSMGQTVEQLAEARKFLGSVSDKRGLAAPSFAPTLVTFVCAEASISVDLFQAMLKAAQASSSKLREFQFRFARPTCGSVAALVACLDLAKVSDALVVVFQAGAEFTETFRLVLSALYAQGLPAQLHAIVLTAADSQKDRKAWERALLADLEGQGFGLPADCGLTAVRGSGELAGLLRRIASRRSAVVTASVSKASTKKSGLAKGHPAFAKSRCYGLVESSASDTSCSGHLRVVTHIRGSGQVGLNVGDMIHLVGWGDYQLTGWSLDPATTTGTMESEMTIDEEEDGVGNDAQLFNVAMETVADAESDVEEPSSENDADTTKQVVKNSEMEFPDEVDTPKDVPARERFKRYRPLTELKAGSWDPWAELPEVFGTLAYFSNFLHARNRAAKAAKAAEYKLRVGQRVAMLLSPVPKDAYPSPSPHSLPALAWYRMLEHEDKMTLVNCSVRLNPDRRTPLKSGSHHQVVWQVGWRRFAASAIFSECDTPSTAAGAPRLGLRHLAPGGRAVASFYAPLTFTPASALALFSTEDCGRRSRLPLLPLMSGSVESCDPNRVVLKRAILSGQPFKIHTRSAVIRYLFFNPEDASHYRDANLRTKHGRRGKILEPVGTHGLCKCRFDGPVTNMDTVLLDLYKRQFPKVTYSKEVSFAA